MSDAATLPKLHKLPLTLPKEGAINIELVEGSPVFRASAQVQQRIETLLEKQLSDVLTTIDEEELDRYAEIDDYLSYLNRLVRNLVVAQ